MAQIIMGFSRHKGFAPLSWLIMLCERTNFSHAYVKLYSASLDRTLIYQATGSGVNFVGSVLFEESAQVVEEYPIEVSDGARTRLLQRCVDNAGKPYGRLQMVGLGVIRVAKLFGIRMKNPFPNGDGKYVCCELVVDALEELGIPGPSDLDQVDLNASRSMVLLAVRGKG